MNDGCDGCDICGCDDERLVPISIPFQGKVYQCHVCEAHESMIRNNLKRKAAE